MGAKWTKDWCTYCTKFHCFARIDSFELMMKSFYILFCWFRHFIVFRFSSLCWWAHLNLKSNEWLSMSWEHWYLIKMLKWILIGIPQFSIITKHDQYVPIWWETIHNCSTQSIYCLFWWMQLFCLEHNDEKSHCYLSRMPHPLLILCSIWTYIAIKIRIHGLIERDRLVRR